MPSCICSLKVVSSGTDMNNAVSLDNHFTGSDVSAALPSGFLWFPCCPSEIKKSPDTNLFYVVNFSKKMPC